MHRRGAFHVAEQELGRMAVLVEMLEEPTALDVDEGLAILEGPTS